MLTILYVPNLYGISTNGVICKWGLGLIIFLKQGFSFENSILFTKKIAHWANKFSTDALEKLLLII